MASGRLLCTARETRLTEELGKLLQHYIDHTVRREVRAAGWLRRRQSLASQATREGRQAARAVNEFLVGASALQR